jgi:hypothetical protein
MAELPKHYDLLGRQLAVGDYIAYPDGNSLRLGTVDKLNPKMVRVRGLKRTWNVNKYASDTVKLDGPDLVMYLLKN